MAELHSITGLFYESFPGISPWGGFFIRGIDDIEDLIEGMLIDTHGYSKIQGVMYPDSLSFLKTYKNKGDSYNYSFSLKDGIWLGEYESTSADYRGRSVCKTNLCINDLSFRKFDLSTPQGYVKALVDSMISSGQLESYKDPETGEEMLRPL